LNRSERAFFCAISLPVPVETKKHNVLKNKIFQKPKSIKTPQVNGFAAWGRIAMGMVQNYTRLTLACCPSSPTFVFKLEPCLPLKIKSLL
jgi:hypothetical protein